MYAREASGFFTTRRLFIAKQPLSARTTRRGFIGISEKVRVQLKEVILMLKFFGREEKLLIRAKGPTPKVGSVEP
jgi:hypothetical protein